MAYSTSTFSRPRSRCATCGSRRGGFGSLAAAVTAEDPRRGKFAQLVADHVFLHEHTQELVAVVNLERVPDELRNDRARPSPGLDGLLGAVLVQLAHLAEELLIHERAFFGASAH